MPLVAVISDIHAHLDDLEAVLLSADDEGCSEVWCLGDFASGAGPDPAGTFDLVAKSCSVVLGGNHEMMVAGKLFEGADGSWARWAREAHRKLGPDRIAQLMGLPSIVDGPQLQMAHAALTDPLWDFVSSRKEADRQLSLMERDFLLVGHTHKAAMWTPEAGSTPKPGQWVDLEAPAILNPGAAEERSWMLLELDGDRPVRAKWLRV